MAGQLPRAPVMTLAQKTRIVLGACYMALVHVAAVLDRPALAIAAAGGLAVVVVIGNLVSRGPRPELAFWCLIGIAMFAALLGGVDGWRDGGTPLLALPVVMNLSFLFIFARTLRPGREPLLVHFSRLNVGEVPESLARYAHRLTAWWSAFFAAAAVIAAGLATFGDIAAWSWFVNVINPAAAAAFYLGEHLYRKQRFHQCGPFSLVRALRIMMRPESWIVPNAETRAQIR